MRIFKIIFLGLLVVLGIYSSNAQNITITDNESHNADASAMLDVYSTSKGMLVPRMTTIQQGLISDPATGLLVFNTDVNSFFFYNGTVWNDLSDTGTDIWGVNGSTGDVYVSDLQSNIGIGTSTPLSKLAVVANAGTNPDAPLFEILDENGFPIFSVTSEGVRIFVKDKTISKGVSGGFAVGQYGTLKSEGDEFFIVTADSTRVYTLPSAKGVSGGFAVGQYGSLKAPGDKYMHMVPENYFIGHSAGLNLTTGLYNSVFGFESGKFMLTADENVFIGYHAGLNMLHGYKNVFIGFEAGLSMEGNTYSDMGSNNVFIGSGAGKLSTGSTSVVSIGTNSGNEGGYLNTFVGNSAGGNQTGLAWRNTFLGYRAGFSGTSGDGNVCIGAQAGENLSDGGFNTLIGQEAGLYAGYSTHSIAIGYQAGRSMRGQNNVIIGNRAGYSISHGDAGNVFIGYQSGYSETGSNRLYIDNSNTTAPLIYGQFDTDLVGINDGVPSANLHIKQKGAGEEGLAIENDTDTDVWSWEIGANDLAINFNGIYKGAWNDVDGVYTSASDKRLKDNIEKISNVMDRVNKLEVVNYYFKDNVSRDYKSIGLIAQDVEKIFPSLVNKPESGVEDSFYSLNYSGFGPIAIKAIQEQQVQIENLGIENEKLRKEIQEIRNLLEKK